MFTIFKFFSSPKVLVWIEYIAEHSDLNLLIQAGKALKNYVQRRLAHVSALGKELAIIDAWSTDLVRLVTKFGKKLSTSPSSIFNLIPPFCPSESALRKQFGSSLRGISILGLSKTGWDDCLSTIVHPQEQFLTIACSRNEFAIGMSSGKIAIYNQTTCLEIRALQHHEPVIMLQFGQNQKILVSAGSKVIRIWSLDLWEEIQSFGIPKQCLLLVLADEDQLLLSALKNNSLMIWDLTASSLRHSVNWTEGLDGTQGHTLRQPILAAISLEQSLLAIVYRGRDIMLWDLEQEALYETYNKDSGASRNMDRGHVIDAGVLCLVFCTSPNTSLLAAGYSEGDIFLFDISEGVVRRSVMANAQVLACSPDGRTLASGDSSGIIQLFEFESLKLLYRIYSEDYGIKDLAFSGDGRYILDIRGSQCRIWDPPVLVRQDMDDENSDTISVSTAQQDVRPRYMGDTISITSVACHGNGQFIFCGKEDGSVYLYDTKSGLQKQKLFSHAIGVTIASLQFDTESGTLTSIDDSSRIMSHKCQFRQERCEVQETSFDHRAVDAVDQFLGNFGHTRLLVSSKKDDLLWSISSAGNKIEKQIPWQDRGAHQWATHPQNHDQLILIVDNILHLYEWATLRQLTNKEGILLEGSILPDLAIKSMSPCFNQKYLATTFTESLRPQSSSNLLLWSVEDLKEDSTIARLVPAYAHLADQVRYLVGDYGGRLIFLDANGWICSAHPGSVQAPTRHFFLPADWLTTNVELKIRTNINGEVVFVKGDELAVIKKGLDIPQQAGGGSSKRPLLTGKLRNQSC